MTARTPKNIVFNSVDKKRQRENFLHPLESYYWYFEAYKENSLMSCICKKFVIVEFQDLKK